MLGLGSAIIPVWACLGSLVWKVLFVLPKVSMHNFICKIKTCFVAVSLKSSGGASAQCYNVAFKVSSFPPSSAYLFYFWVNSQASMS